MKMQIEELVLWPKNQDKKIKDIHFALGKVNYIVGNSMTGKSAIIHIIDYVLGASSSKIPEGIIIDKTDWFGIVFNLEHTKVLIARRNQFIDPNSVYIEYIDKDDFTIPQNIIKNINTEQLKEELNKLSGLSRLSFKENDKDINNPAKSRPSFRDLVSFIFQPQYIIANPTTIFFKTDSFKYRERLKTIIKYILGIDTVDELLLMQEISLLNGQLKSIEYKMKQTEKTIENTRPDIERIILDAMDSGLCSEKMDISSLSLTQLAESIYKIQSNYRTKEQTISESIKNASEELFKLQDQEGKLSSEIFQLKENLYLIETIKALAKGTKNSLEQQKDKLQIANEINIVDGICPFCKNTVNNQDEILNLQKEFAKIDSAYKQLDNPFELLYKDYLTTSKTLKEKEQQLNDVQKNIALLESKQNDNDTMAKNKYSRLSLAEKIGRIVEYSRFLNSLLSFSMDSDKDYILSEIKKKNDALNSSKKEHPQDFSSNLNKRITELSKKLDIEHSNASAELSLETLEIKIDTKRGSSFLSSIGSAANWLSYHIATMLAISEHFLSFKSVVPSFIVLDQPSQVYFPTQRGIITSTEKLDDRDLIAVQAIYKLINNVTNKLKPNFQIIILEHAEKSYWEVGEKGITHLVADWKSGDKLIPEDW